RGPGPGVPRRIRAEQDMNLPQPRPALLGRRPDPGAGPRPGRRADHLPDGHSWCMKPASLIVDPSQTWQTLKDLGLRPTPPPGWTFGAVILDQDLILTPDDGGARIPRDDLGNTHDRVEARTATTSREARHAGACGRRRRRARRSGSKPAPRCLHGATA